MSSQAPLPNFLVIGAQRCATSWLYFCLKEHPDVYLPYIKEVSYFSDYHDKGPEWYRRYFAQWSGQKAVGEVTPSYIYREGVAERIARDLPDVKLIVTFRNPIERAFSQYQKHVRKSLALDFETALERDPEYVERGYYYRQLLRYEKLFPKNRILVLIYEDIKKDPSVHLGRILTFLGVDPSRVPPSAEKIIPSEALGSGLYKYSSPVTTFLRHKLGLGAAIDVVKKSPLMPAVDKLFYHFGPAPKSADAKKAAKPSMRPETRAKLAALFDEENRELAAHLGRDLSFWK
jgi:hypothetical protein